MVSVVMTVQSGRVVSAVSKGQPGHRASVESAAEQASVANPVRKAKDYRASKGRPVK